MKKQRLGGALLLLSVMIGVAVICWPTLYPSQPVPTPANFNRLYIGIQQSDVAAILGPQMHREMTYNDGVVLSDTWESDGCKILIQYGGPLDVSGSHTAINGELTTDDGRTLKLQPRAPGILETVRGWLGF